MCEVASCKDFENSLTTVKVMTITKVAPFYQGHGVDAFVTLIWYHPYTPQPIKTGKPAIGVSDRSLVNALLRQTPDSVVDWVQIRTVRWPQIWRDELRCLLLQELDSLTCPVCRRTAHCLAGIQSCRLQCDAWLAVSVASARLHGNTTTVIFKFKNAWRNTKKNEIK